MASWQYRCKSCGKTHAALRLPEGTMYLRCLVTRGWAWYEPSSFRVVLEGAGARSAGGTGTPACRARSASGWRRAGVRPPVGRAGPPREKRPGRPPSGSRGPAL